MENLTEHCYRVQVKVSVPRVYTYEGYVTVPVGYEAYVDTYLTNNDGFDWELVEDKTSIKPDNVVSHLDVFPFEWETLYDTNADELEE